MKIFGLGEASNAEINSYARGLAEHLRNIAKAQDDAKDLIASAKEAGLNVKALRNVAKEMTMEQEKREKIYEDEDQLEMFREAVGLTGGLRVAAE